MWQLSEPESLLLALIPLAAALFFILKKRRTGKRQIAFSGHQKALQKEIRAARGKHRLLFLGALVALATFAYVAARPVQIDSWSRRWTEGIDIVVLLDVSESMDAEDLAPTRILSAKKVIRDFIAKRSDDRIGFVIFGGEAVTKSPLTRDYDFLLSQVEDIRLRELKQGTAIGMGLANAVGGFATGVRRNKRSFYSRTGTATS